MGMKTLLAALLALLLVGFAAPAAGTVF